MQIATNSRLVQDEVPFRGKDEFCRMVWLFERSGYPYNDS